MIRKVFVKVQRDWLRREENPLAGCSRNLKLLVFVNNFRWSINQLYCFVFCQGPRSTSRNTWSRQSEPKVACVRQQLQMVNKSIILRVHNIIMSSGLVSGARNWGRLFGPVLLTVTSVFLASCSLATLWRMANLTRCSHDHPGNTTLFLAYFSRGDHPGNICLDQRFFVVPWFTTSCDLLM